MKEQGIQNQILTAMGRKGAYALRINSGTFWGGKMVKHDGKYLVLENPTKIQGAIAGTSDIVGCKPITITPEMVGNKIGRFVAIEVKKPGENAKDHQAKYLSVMKSMGAIVGVARSPEDAIAILEGEL
jgi:hypothetical protein